MTDDQMNAVVQAVAHLAYGLDPDPARNHPLSDEARGARAALTVLKEAGVELPARLQPND